MTGNYDVLFRNYHELLVTVDESGFVLDVNEAALHELGYSTSELIGSPIEVLCPLKVKISDILNGVTLDVSVLRKNRTEFSSEVKILDISDERVKQYLIVIQKCLLKQSTDDIFRRLFYESGDAYLTLDNGVFSACNDKSGKLLLMNPKDVIGLTPWAISPLLQYDGQDSKEKARRMVEQAENKGNHRFEWIHKKSNNEEFWAEIVLTPLRHLDGTTTQLVTWRDISDRKNIEQENNKLVERLSLATGSSHIGLWDWDITSGEVEFNEEWAKTCGYSLSELGFTTIETLEQFTHPNDRDMAKLKLDNYFNGLTSSYECETRMKHKNGNWIWVLDRGKVVKQSGDGKPLRMIGTQTEITHIKENNRKLEQAMEEANHMAMLAEKADDVKSQFLANVSHEIRTPLNGVVGFLEMLKFTELTSEQVEYVIEASTSTELMLNIVNDLLDYSKFEDGKVELEHIRFDIRNCIEEAINIVLPNAEEKSINVYNMIYSNVPSKVKGDPTRLKQILINLLSNAIKFTKEGEIVLNVKLVELLDNKAQLHFSISDTGIGMTDETLNILFKPFTQADASTTRKYGGTGLGLSICKKLVNLMDGDIQVASRYGHGATFSFDIHLVVEETEENTLLDFKILRDRKILIVDDHMQNRKILCEYLRPLTTKIDIARSVKEAISMLDGQYELILIDYQMPELNGIDLAKYITSTNQGAKLVLLSSSYEKRHHSSEFSDMFAGYLVKPIKRNDLLKTLMVVMSQDTSLNHKENLTSKLNMTELFQQFKPHLLLVEDNLINQKLLISYFDKKGALCDIATNGFEAIEAVNKRKYDLIFMDCQMPKMDGYTATKYIREQEGENKHIPIIAMTAHVLPEEKEKCRAAGMNDYLSKPIKFEEMDELIVHYVHPSKEEKYNQLFIEDAKKDLMAISGLELEDVEDIYDEYLRITPSLVENLEKACRVGDKVKVAGLVHQIKGSSANLRIHTIEEQMSRIELGISKEDDYECLNIINHVKSLLGM